MSKWLETSRTPYVELKQHNASTFEICLLLLCCPILPWLRFQILRSPANPLNRFRARMWSQITLVCLLQWSILFSVVKRHPSVFSNGAQKYWLSSSPGRKFFFATLDKPSSTMKKRSTCQTSIDTHPVHKTEVKAKRAEIIATLYTANACANAAILADSARV